VLDGRVYRLPAPDDTVGIQAVTWGGLKTLYRTTTPE
jgi:hypothetical protein